MTSLALVARPRLPVDHLEYASFININCRYGEFSNTELGGEGEDVCPNESAIERFPTRIKEIENAKNTYKRFKRGTLAYFVMVDGLVCRGSLNSTI